MNITDFLDMHNIRWHPVPMLYYNGEEGDYILIDTTVVHQIDIDEPCKMMDELILDFPYYESKTKKLPHFFCRMNAGGMFGQFNDCKVDYMRGFPVHAKRDAIVHNAHLPIKNIILS